MYYQNDALFTDLKFSKYLQILFLFSSLGIGVSLPYLIYKCLIGLVLFAHIFLKLEQWPYSNGHPPFGTYFVYATHWGQMIMTRFFQNPILFFTF